MRAQMMTEKASAWRRLVRFVQLLPETCGNCLRFRVLFVLPRWFRMPAQMRVGNRFASLQFLDEEGVGADFITCVLRNSYGLRNKLPDVWTIVDVGANIGFFSLAARARYKGATIHAYEPNPRVYGILQANTAGFGIQVYPEAVGGCCGKAKLIDDGPSNQARLLVAENGGNGLEVLQVDLGTVVRRAGGQIDLLKLDCEGAEWEILQPGPAWQSIRNIRLEYHLYHGESAQRALQMLTGFGYSIQRFEPSHEYGGVIWAARK